MEKGVFQVEVEAGFLRVGREGVVPGYYGLLEGHLVSFCLRGMEWSGVLREML
jgi:hypothetical protein